MGLGPSIEPSQVGVTGLVWLFLSYGYVLYEASNLISEGSDLLMLIPSVAGLVGGVVLPLLGAVPDGAIILFSGLGDKAAAQETLSVGVGALAGSTIMLLTVPWAMCVYSGRVDLLPDGTANYLSKPKLSPKETLAEELSESGVVITQAITHGGIVMVITTLPYFLIQIPAYFIHGPTEEVAHGEHWWSLLGLIVCLVGLASYMRLQLHISQEGQDRDKRMAVLKKLLKKGQVSLSGAVASHVRQAEQEAELLELQMQNIASPGYQSLTRNNNTMHLGDGYPSPTVAALLKEVLADAFFGYDADGNGELDRREVYTFFRDLHETISEEEMERLFVKFDTDKSNMIDLDEFIGLAYNLIKAQDTRATTESPSGESSMMDVSQNRATMAESVFAEVEEEEVPEEFTDLSPEQQQLAITKRALLMLSAGTFLVVLFSDPMVDVMQEIAVRLHISPFSVSFVLAPVASNASEFIASQYYASKKTSKSITVSLTALEGAACMNNTFCLSIFMGLIFFRGLAWEFSAETIAIVTAELMMGLLVRTKCMSLGKGLVVLSIFPLSIALVATLEAMGFD